MALYSGNYIPGYKLRNDSHTAASDLLKAIEYNSKFNGKLNSVEWNDDKDRLELIFRYENDPSTEL